MISSLVFTIRFIDITVKLNIQSHQNLTGFTKLESTVIMKIEYYQLYFIINYFIPGIMIYCMLYDFEKSLNCAIC